MSVEFLAIVLPVENLPFPSPFGNVAFLRGDLLLYFTIDVLVTSELLLEDLDDRQTNGVRVAAQVHGLVLSKSIDEEARQMVDLGAR